MICCHAEKLSRNTKPLEQFHKTFKANFHARQKNKIHILL